MQRTERGMNVYRGICRRQRNSADTLQSRRALDGNELRKFPVDVVKDGFGASGAESNNARGGVGGRGS